MSDSELALTAKSLTPVAKAQFCGKGHGALVIYKVINSCTVNLAC